MGGPSSYSTNCSNEVLNFCKLAKQTETMRNNQLCIFWETLKLTQYQSKEFSFISLLYRTNEKAYAFN